MVEGLGFAQRRIARGEVEELNLRRSKERISLGPSLVEVTTKDLARVAVEGGLVKVLDVAEHASRRFVLCGPREQFKGGRVGTSENIGFVHA